MRLCNFADIVVLLRREEWDNFQWIYRTAVVMSLTIEQAFFISQGIGYQYAIFQRKLISFFFLLVSLNFFFFLVWNLVQTDRTWRPNRLRDFPREKILLSRVSDWIKMGQNPIEDALLASFHIINIVELSARRGIYKNGMTRSRFKYSRGKSKDALGLHLEFEVYVNNK
jgi:hypothetical protein